VADSVLLDTCAALWLMNGEPMSNASRKMIHLAGVANVGIYVSAITAWEIGTLVSKGRIQVAISPQVWFDTLVAMPGVRLAELTPEVLLGSTALPGTPPSDPADRMVAATARLNGYRVITRDRKLLAYARQGHMLATSC
jgi:PIN domain nuclease of toxin-antitoxin system